MKFNSIARKMIVSMRDGQLYIGPSDMNEVAPVEVTPVATPIRINLDNISEPQQFDLLTCAAKLRAAQLLPPVVVFGSTALSFDSKRLTQLADVGIAYQDASFTIV